MAGFFKTIKKFTCLFNPKERKIILEDLVELDGIGKIQIDSINNFFENNLNKKIINDLINELNIIDFKIQTKKVNLQIKQ